MKKVYRYIKVYFMLSSALVVFSACYCTGYCCARSILWLLTLLSVCVCLCLPDSISNYWWLWSELSHNVQTVQGCYTIHEWNTCKGMCYSLLRLVIYCTMHTERMYLLTKMLLHSNISEPLNTQQAIIYTLRFKEKPGSLQYFQITSANYYIRFAIIC